MDPAYPLERLSFMMEDAQIEMLLTQKKLIHRLPEFTGPVVSLDSPRKSDIQGLTDNLRHADSADQLAYVMYTSGSTGKPKGVAVVHRGIVRLVKETNYVNLTSDEVILQFAPISFDASTFEIWGGLLNGARLVIFPDHLPSLKELGDILKQYRITTLWLTAGLFHQMVSNHLEGLKPVRQLLAGGDVLSPNLVKKALETLDGCRLINGYGPTENTTFTCCHVMTDSRQVGDTVSIGRPISNTQVHILDKHLKPVPVGVTGELFIGGDGLARGYLNQPELTQEKFISNPFSEDPESRLYRSGDLVRYRPDGLIEFLGRKDTQVKIRGFRIELGEIEAVLMIHSSVREVAVAVRENMHGDKRIAAYVVLKPGKSLNTEVLRAFVMEKLPEYMVPSAFVLLDALPLTSNGKVDRKALPALSADQERLGRTYKAPRDSLEIQLVKIWEKTLSRGNIGITDNFFDLGGHSLLAIQVISQIKKYLGKEIAVADLFKHPDIEHLSAIMRSEGWSSRFSLLIPFQPLGSKPPFFCLHGAVAEAANLIGLEQPFFGGIPHGFFGGRIPASVEEIAAEYLREIRTVQPEGPYYVGGYSFGGMVAFEVAQQLKSQGQKVALLVLIDATESSDSEKSLKNITKIMDGHRRLSRIRRKLNQVGKRFMELNAAEKIAYVLKGVWRRFFVKTGIERKMKEYICRGCVSVGIPLSDSLKKFYRSYVFLRVARIYTPRKYDGQAVLFQ
ncbi:MAG: amino acid adenylation domain-containing protein, partial [Thermodesulfobacteriota bacterium]|nr:amino acid adenylation domain-containing protein [Thermodesulfobacteriota bacterium]